MENQGKRRSQIKDSEIFSFIAIVAIGLLILLITLLT
jgi:hypothetical protein